MLKYESFWVSCWVKWAFTQNFSEKLGSANSLHMNSTAAPRWLQSVGIAPTFQTCRLSEGHWMATAVVDMWPLNSQLICHFGCVTIMVEVGLRHTDPPWQPPIATERPAFPTPLAVALVVGWMEMRNHVKTVKNMIQTRNGKNSP